MFTSLFAISRRVGRKQFYGMWLKIVLASFRKCHLQLEIQRNYRYYKYAYWKLVTSCIRGGFYSSFIFLDMFAVWLNVFWEKWGVRSWKRQYWMCLFTFTNPDGKGSAIKWRNNIREQNWWDWMRRCLPLVKCWFS